MFLKRVCGLQDRVAAGSKEVEYNFYVWTKIPENPIPVN